MVDLIIKLIEKLSELAVISSKQKISKFDNLIKPIYNDLEKIHQDYISMMENAILILKENNDISEAKKSIIKDRLNKKSLRIKIIEFSNILILNKNLKQYSNFFNSIRSYFYKDDPRHAEIKNINTYSYMLMNDFFETEENILKASMFDEIDDDEKANYSKDLQDLIISYIESLDNSWRNISKQYINLLNSIC